MLDQRCAVIIPCIKLGKMEMKLKAIVCMLCIAYALPVWAQTEAADNHELSTIKVVFSDDQSIIAERVMYEVLRRSG